jgi:hypothetical protein
MTTKKIRLPFWLISTVLDIILSISFTFLQAKMGNWPIGYVWSDFDGAWDTAGGSHGAIKIDHEVMKE